MSRGFQYHACATGVAGRITSPFTHLIETRAPSALAPHGGYSSSRVDRFRFKEIISFRSAYTQVSGAWSAETNSWDTVMVSVVEGLNILDTLEADRIVARLASRHVRGEDEPSIIPLGSRIDGLRIAGLTLNFTLDVERYTKADTYSKVVGDSGRYGLLGTSIVREAGEGSCGLEIEVDQFGTVIIGQLVIGEMSRHLTMLQVRLGCAVNGDASAGSGDVNGTPMPPPQRPPK